IQRAYGQPEQVIITMPLLTGTDGMRKMSKSENNYIGVTESPEQIYGKTLSIPDASLSDWYSLLLGIEPDQMLSPRNAKRALARALVERFHNPAAAVAAEQRFDQVHVRRELPGDVPEVHFEGGNGVVHLPLLLAQAFGVSTSEARRSLAQGGVRIDGEQLPDDALDVPGEHVDGKVLQL